MATTRRRILNAALALQEKLRAGPSADREAALLARWQATPRR